jgi:Tfp pilus assembly protein PilW
MMRRSRRHRDGETGMTLVELLVVVLLTGIIAAVMVAAFIVTTRSDRQTGQDAQSLANLRIATDRIEKDLRQARRVYMDSNATRLRIWVDSDRDNQQDLAERITFSLTTDNGLAPAVGGSTATLRRTTAAPGAPNMIMASGMQLFPTSATFEYRNTVNPSTPAFTPVAGPTATWTDTSLVKVTLAADEAPGPYPGPRTLLTEVRLRNATTY